METTPLLGIIDDSSPYSSATSTSKRHVLSYKLQSHFSKWATLYICGLMVFLVDFGEFMVEAARIRRLELGICREYYIIVDPQVIRGDGGIPEELCKLDEIQSELARMRGFLGLLENIPGINFVDAL
jgi:hypothetical protein